MKKKETFKIELDITQRCIDNANKREAGKPFTYEPCMKCPIALALRGHKGTKFHDVSVGSEEADLVTGTGKNKRTWYATLPVRVQKFIRNFDGGSKVKPFKFTLKFETEEVA